MSRLELPSSLCYLYVARGSLLSIYMAQSFCQIPPELSAMCDSLDAKKLYRVYRDLSLSTYLSVMVKQTLK